MKKLSTTIRALVFDLDDTLYPEIQYVQSGFHAVAARLAGPQQDAQAVFERLWQAFNVGPRNQVFNTVLKQLGRKASQQRISELVSVYRSHPPALKLQTSVANTLTKLHEHYKLGLLTDGFLPAQELKVKALQLEAAFDHIIYTEKLGRQFWKPAPQPFEQMAQTLRCPAKHCVYVADNPAKDFVAPNSLGWQTVQLQLPERIHADQTAPPDGQPHFVIGSIADLADLLPNPPRSNF